MRHLDSVGRRTYNEHGLKGAFSAL